MPPTRAISAISLPRSVPGAHRRRREQPPPLNLPPRSRLRWPPTTRRPHPEDAPHRSQPESIAKKHRLNNRTRSSGGNPSPSSPTSRRAPTTGVGQQRKRRKPRDSIREHAESQAAAKPIPSHWCRGPGTRTPPRRSSVPLPVDTAGWGPPCAAPRAASAPARIVGMDRSTRIDRRPVTAADAAITAAKSVCGLRPKPRRHRSAMRNEAPQLRPARHNKRNRAKRQRAKRRLRTGFISTDRLARHQRRCRTQRPPHLRGLHREDVRVGARDGEDAPPTDRRTHAGLTASRAPPATGKPAALPRTCGLGSVHVKPSWEAAPAPGAQHHLDHAEKPAHAPHARDRLFGLRRPSHSGRY